MCLDTTSVLHLTELIGKADFKILPLNLPSLIFFLDSHWQLHMYPDLRTELIHRCAGSPGYGPANIRQPTFPSRAGIPPAPLLLLQEITGLTQVSSLPMTPQCLRCPNVSQTVFIHFHSKVKNVSKWALRDFL